MKNKLLAVLATLSMVASASAVKINNNLSINGFLDGSYKLTDTSGGTDTQKLTSDEAELNFVLTNGAASGLIAIDSGNLDTTTGLNIEQAHFSYDLGNGISVTFGRYGSALGFEREDPAGLYTFSRAYSDGSSFNLGNIDQDGAVNEGVSIAYAADAFSVAASFENGRGKDLEVDDLDLEVSFSYTGIADTTIGGGYRFDNEPGVNASHEVDVLNLHASRSFGKFLFAIEYSELSQDNNDRDAYLFLVDYDYNDKIGAALRFSNEELDSTKDYEKVTIAPNYSITENLGAIIEFSDIENAGTDSNEVAVELTYTF